MRRGHGFHFLAPPDVYIDVMGRPPRVGRFAGAWSRLLALEAVECQERGRRHWIPIVRELKALRREGKLIPPGTAVSSLLAGDQR
jgi:hypothetical protein